MEIVEVVDLTSEEKIFVFNLWNAEYPAKIAYDKVSDLDGFLEIYQKYSITLLKKMKTCSAGQ